ncbi:hypothetical protein [Mesorhizobium sp. YM1C-6-2]|uniref:hypothetical protein n=1 Tax=Mesorhizobium sp. YM1C-6-2 TaxID=1827501 RepID=UPI000EF240B0|nr:hypothetical protein [Mesorhizobium sp. YM1C-6-2]RLP26323.1 hypothetical protein D8676_11675 [Mesorhizobium sp. YM1C-6-2]
MSFDNVARIAGFTGADLSALLAVFAKASANIDPTHHDELGRRLIKLYRAGVRDPDMLESFAADALKPSRRKREVPRTLYGEAGIINVCDM